MGTGSVCTIWLPRRHCRKYWMFYAQVCAPVLWVDPKPDFSIFPDEDCKKMMHSLQLQKRTQEEGGFFDFEPGVRTDRP